MSRSTRRLEFLADFFTLATKFQNSFTIIIPPCFRIVIGKVTSEALDLFRSFIFVFPTHVTVLQRFTLQEMTRAIYNQLNRSDDISKFYEKVNLIESKRTFFLIRINTTLKIRYARRIRQVRLVFRSPTRSTTHLHLSM